MGTTVFKDKFSRTFKACQSRIGQCMNVCCTFGLGNYLFAPAWEVEEAKKQGLSLDRLSEFTEVTADAPNADGTTTPMPGYEFKCNRWCQEGEWKPFDCAIYSLALASEDCTRFLVGDKRKCPVPDSELIVLAVRVQKLALALEKDNPGHIRTMVTAAKSYKAFQPFPHEVKVLNADTPDEQVVIRRLTEDEIKEITPIECLPDDFKANYVGVDASAYTARTTPDDVEWLG